MVEPSHSHRCEKCGTKWSHSQRGVYESVINGKIDEYRQSHTCPSCKADDQTLRLDNDNGDLWSVVKEWEAIRLFVLNANDFMEMNYGSLTASIEMSACIIFYDRTKYILDQKENEQ